MSDPEPTPAEEQVRRLLADARHDEPMPAEVVDRLDRVLAGLDLGRPTPPVDLAARRRRRTARTLLVAASAVVVLAVGFTQLDLGGGGGDAGSAQRSEAGGASAPQSDVDGDSAGDRSQLATGPPVVLSSAGFGTEVRALLAAKQGSASARPIVPSLPPACADLAVGPGERLAVQYDGEPGVLVLRPPSGDRQRVDLYLCGETAVVRSSTVAVG
ncbi:hypothetical protein [Nocardioides sp. URHA0020]|uniref:hypothetical protein n=1 Tax=Nocardioides sp. URHA0020 TaxID=1380392 RepID=UPI00048D3A65|nr:hypothetical protein [Nocardioides sp. URHA0020]